MKKIILASKSPRRAELLKVCGFDYVIESKTIDEEKIRKDFLKETKSFERICKLAEELAKRKAEAVFRRGEDLLVLGADTLVVLDDKIYGKPKDEEETRKMLESLAGKRHQVISGVALITDDKIISFHQRTDVTFYSLDENVQELIEKYIETGSPFDKAGAYGIQDMGGLLVKEIEGDYYNVVGLPIARLYRELRALI